MLAASPSTTIMTAEVWFTVAPRVTVSTTQTVSTQSIITVEKAAPSFTQVWGPKAGCDDIGMASAQTFMVATMTEEQVTNICKATCMTNNFWNCYINTHGFDEEKDLDCNKDTSIWGMAKGYRLSTVRLNMDDLLNTDWKAPAPAAKQNVPRPAFGMPMPIPSAASSSRASPAPSPFASNLPAPKAPSKAPSPGNDIFANLVSTNVNKNQGNLSLLERQKQLQQEKAKQEQEQRQRYAQQYGNETSFWDNLGSGKGTPQPTAQRTVPPAQEHEDDILAAFNSAAPVDKSSHFPVPAASAVTSGRNTPAFANSNNSAALLADDDDPFGLGAAPQRKPSPYQPPPASSNNDDDDILGDLGKPVTAKPPRRDPPRREPVDEAFAVEDHRSPPSSDPLDRPIAELVDMGFPADRSRAALQETGGDVQSAVGWLLNQAHQESKERTQNRGSARASPAPQVREEVRRGRGAEDASVPAWMRQESRPTSNQRRQDNGTPNSDKDVAAYAQEFGTSFLKSAGSLWKTGQKNLKKAVAEFQQPEGDSSTPKWMRDASADAAAPRPGRSSTPRTSAPAQTAEELTNEAMLLEARDERQRPTKSRTPEMREPISRPDSRVRSPAQDLPVRTQPQSRFAQQAPPPQAQRPNTKVSRFDVEEESSQAYVSSARRRRPAKPEPQPEPQPEVDLFSPAPTQPPPQPTTTRSTPAPRPAAAKSSTPIPQAPRPKAPPRNIPSISPSALSTSSNHRRAGTDAFKRGDFDAAHTSYSAALTPLPPTHPLIIVVLSNRALTAIKTGDPKAAIIDADRALSLIGNSKGENETISLGNGEGEKDMKEFYGKALMRKAEALENMEKWSEAAAVWKDAIAAGVGGAVSLRARDRCEKAVTGGAAKPAPTAAKPKPKSTPAAAARTPAGHLAQPARLAVPAAQSQEAVRKLREANAAADKADDEKFALSDQVSAKVTAWKGGKADNLRALLQSLDSVLWPEAGWKKVSMADLIMANKVKIVYMKAIAKVHPDKIPQTATTEQKMISGSVFSTLNEAWDKFKKDNGL
ncbi:hypothetical protein E4T47_01087 [Aureobasidium subglaciale]|nr:hypothetical protein E4T47_01087 [Aureobasidium subglaciale]